jgi:glutamate synthase (NADPH/NADH) small chain
VLEINEGAAVSIKQIELAIVNRAWDEGWIVPVRASTSTGRSVAVVGSGPSGLACAQQLARAGEKVTVYERDEAAGGLIRFGVPEFKIEKWLVERRVEQLAAEGVEFRLGVDVGVDVDLDELRSRHDAIVLAIGSRIPRDLPVPGRELRGVHFAMEYLAERARVIAGTAEATISAAGKHVVVIGGGDTGADCVGHAHREGAASVTQIELLGEPPRTRPDHLTPWPAWPMKLRTSYALKEGGDRDFSISTTRLEGRDGEVEQIVWQSNSGRPPFDLLPETEETRPADLVLLAMGFTGPELPLLDGLGIEQDARGNIDAPRFATSRPGIFAAGDARRGQSLIVWAIDEGRRCADAVRAWLDRPDTEPDAATFVSIVTSRAAE